AGQRPAERATTHGQLVAGRAARVPVGRQVMLTRGIRLRVVAFVVIGVVAVVYAGGRYAGLDRLFGGSGYTLTPELAESGGVSDTAGVRYRGGGVGRVGLLHLVREGVAVDLRMGSSGRGIPAAPKAVVASRSAIGEQYVDLQPASPDGPYLASGSVIPRDR